MAPIDWTDEDYQEARVRRRIDHVLRHAVQPLINAWDGNDVGWLLPGLDAEKLEQELGQSMVLEYARGIRFLLEARMREVDLRWPEPWDEVRCPFAFAADRNGRFLRRRYRHTGSWEVGTWTAGWNCRFDEQRHASGVDYDEYWTDEDERLLKIDMDLGDLDSMPTALRKWGGDNVQRAAFELQRARELKRQHGRHPTWADREAKVMRAVEELRNRRDLTYPKWVLDELVRELRWA